MSTEMIAALTRQFEGEKALTAVSFNGEPCVIASELGAALGYSLGGRKLTTMIGSSWSTEFEEGRHYLSVSGPDLADLKAVLALDPCEGSSGLSPRTPRLTLLTLAGIDLVLLKTDKPVGAKLRTWLVDEVFPALREQGSYSLVEAEPEPDAEPAPPADLRERRLWANLQLRTAKKAAEVAKRMGLEEFADRVVLQTCCSVLGVPLEAGAQPTPAPVRPALPAPDPDPEPPAPPPEIPPLPRRVEGLKPGWLTEIQMAAELGVERHAVRRMIGQLGSRRHPESYARVKGIRMYAPATLERLREVLGVETPVSPPPEPEPVAPAEPPAKRRPSGSPARQPKQEFIVTSDLAERFHLSTVVVGMKLRKLGFEGVRRKSRGRKVTFWPVEAVEALRGEMARWGEVESA